MNERHLVLVGLMGAGKTTVGERAAELMARTFVDTDALVEQLCGMSVSDVFARAGEAKFRELERQAVLDAVSSPVPLVIGCGGGAVLDPDNRRALRSAGVVVWLQAPAAVLAERVQAEPARPLLAGADSQVATLERLAALRAAAYEASADVTVETAGRSIDEVAAAVCEEFARCRA